ncbi:MAG: hypothetical protein V5B36_14195 [Candidatus Accumulibacter sp. UW25]
MNGLRRLVERWRLLADIGLHRHGPWWLLLAGVVALLVSVAGVVIPRQESELAARLALLSELQVQTASRHDGQDEAPALVPVPEQHYATFQDTLASEGDILASIKAVLDAATSHQLLATRAEYLRGRDAHAQAEFVQMTVPVKGRYPDVRRWIEEILASQPHLAVNELGFKREEIGVDRIEAKVRLTLWHRPAKVAARLADPGPVER